MYSIARVMRANSRLSRNPSATESGIDLTFISMAGILRADTAGGDPILAPRHRAAGIGRKPFQQHGGKFRQAATPGIRDVEDGQLAAWNHPERAAIVVGDAQRFVAVDIEPGDLHARFRIDA